MPEFTDQQIREIKTFFVDQLPRCMEIGLLAPLATILDQRRNLIVRTGRRDFIEIVDSATAWRAEAEEYERHHGPESLLNWDHPKMVATAQAMEQEYRSQAEAANPRLENFLRRRYR